MSRAPFIVLEGVDGAGTTTHTKALAATLEALGVRTHTTREPSDGPIGVMIRQILTHRLVVPTAEGPRPPSWKTMALLFAADRADHVEAEIEPLLERGVLVLSDRYDHSSVAYQSATVPERDRAAEVARWVRELNKHARRPDLTLVLDVSPEVAASRRTERGKGAEIYEGQALQRELTRFYGDIERHFPEDTIVHVDSSGPREEVAARILAHVERVRATLAAAAGSTTAG